MGQIRGGIMKKIDITSINFDKLIALDKNLASESIVYHNNELVYKIYKDFSIS